MVGPGAVAAACGIVPQGDGGRLRAPARGPRSLRALPSRAAPALGPAAAEDFLKLINETCFIYGAVGARGLGEARPSLHKGRVGGLGEERGRRESHRSVCSLENKGGEGRRRRVEIVDLLNKEPAGREVRSILLVRTM